MTVKNHKNSSYKKLLSFVTVTIALGGARVFPVMVMNKFINKKSFSNIDWLISFMLCLGCIIFVFANETSNAEVLGKVEIFENSYSIGES